MTPLAAWVLAAMHALADGTPVDVDESWAPVIATVAEEAPVYPGAQGPKRTAALLVAVAWAESKFDQEAKGDGGKACTAWQVHAGNRCSTLVSDVTEAAREARERMRYSLRTCRLRPHHQKLAAYCSGSCERGGIEAAVRHHLAEGLLKSLK